ncbi:amidohydrolase family protein [Georgenia wangjunii]|uniref:amidohydrolase family protein n=1 Tax=Georgenia wangjunii TaxID=3117730 RepID=UPI002F269B27
MTYDAIASPTPVDELRRVYDVHAHIVPAALVTAQAGGQPRVRVGSRETPPVPRALADVGTRLAAMDRAGVDVQVVSPWVELQPAGLPPAEALAHVRRVNDALAEEVATAPGRLVAMGMLPLHDGEAAAAELERVVAALGMCGALLTTSGVGLDLADAALAPLWEAARRRRALLMLHPYRPVAADRTVPAGTGDLVGTPLESTVAVAGMLRAGVLEGGPDLRLCVVHGGGALPVLAGRLDALWGADQPGRAPSSQLADLYFDTLTHDVRALGWLREFAGDDRLLLGSDFPFPTGDPDPVGRVDALAGLAPHARAAILGGTLERVLADVDHARGGREG